MKITEIADTLSLKIIRNEDADTNITAAYTSDLLSDVMANAPDDSLLITIQGHKNTIAVASLAGIRGIIVCNDRPIPEDMISAANEEDIAILSTSDDQFTVSGKLFKLIND